MERVATVTYNPVKDILQTIASNCATLAMGKEQALILHNEYQ